MRSSFWILGALTVAQFGCAQTLVSELRGTDSPKNKRFDRDHIRNGDFFIVTDCVNNKCGDNGDYPMNACAGDGVDEWTVWHFDFTSWTGAETCEIESASLELDITPKHWALKTDDYRPVCGLALANDPIHACTEDVPCEPPIAKLDKDGSHQLQDELARAPIGMIRAQYQDDAVVTGARLELQCADTRWHFWRPWKLLSGPKKRPATCLEEPLDPKDVPTPLDTNEKSEGACEPPTP